MLSVKLILVTIHVKKNFAFVFLEKKFIVCNKCQYLYGGGLTLKDISYIFKYKKRIEVNIKDISHIFLNTNKQQILPNNIRS